MKSLGIFCLITAGLMFGLGKTAVASEMAPVVIRVADSGLMPNTRLNVEPLIRKWLRTHRDHPVHLVFPAGRYDFWPHHRDEALFAPSVAFDLTGMKNVTVTGAGTAFVFHGRMMPFRIDHATDIRLEGFSIDWDRPFISQGQIVSIADDYVDMSIDSRAYPYEIVGDSIFFLGEGWRSPITKNYNNLYDKDRKEIVYQTRDNPLGDLPGASVSKLDGDLVRFHFRPKVKPEVGTFVALYHGAYITDGILVINSERVEIADVTIYHTLSCGVSGYRSTDISLKNVQIIANEAKGRVFSVIADATHFNGCKGTIAMDGVTMTGAGDDFTNVHGMYAPVDSVTDDRSVMVKPNARYIGFDEGEIAWVIDTLTMQPKDSIRVVGQETVWHAGKVVGYRVTFDRPHRGAVSAGDLLENADRNPDVFIRNCRVLKRHRARGILVTTAGKVVIEHNYFNTAGAAILIEGDTDLWYESGGVRDVLISNNVFENCYTSGNNIIDSPWGWGEGVITITPSIRPDRSDFPAFHRNIRIMENTFRHYDHAILYARSVSGLVFAKNRLLRTFDYEPFYRPVGIYLDGCDAVTLADNDADDDFLGKSIHFEHMRKREITQRGQRVFK